MANLILTLLGPDRPGLVEALADPIAAHGGNWLESRMAHLAGKFAGIPRLEVPDDRTAALERALAADLMVQVTLEGPEERPGP